MLPTHHLYIETRGNWVLIQPGGCPHEEGSCIIWHPTRTKETKQALSQNSTVMNYHELLGSSIYVSF